MCLRFLLAIAASLWAATAAAPSPIGPLHGPVPVLNVVDGDTVVLQSNLGPRIVRLIGIDAPETRDSQEHAEPPFGPEARAFTDAILPAGTHVWAELDFETEDVYGRLLAYLYVEDPDGAWNIDGRSVTQVNLAIAEAGLARTLPIEPNTTYADLYEAAVRTAREAELGIWSPRTEGGSAAAGVADQPAPERGPIHIACALYDPATPGDDGEWVSLRLDEPLDTRGYYLYDAGSKTRLRLPPGEQGPGEIRVTHEGQGIWNNGGDTIHLMLGNEVVDAWDYSEQLAEQGTIVCRDD